MKCESLKQQPKGISTTTVLLIMRFRYKKLPFSTLKGESQAVYTEIEIFCTRRNIISIPEKRGGLIFVIEGFLGFYDTFYGAFLR